MGTDARLSAGTPVRPLSGPREGPTGRPSPGHIGLHPDAGSAEPGYHLHTDPVRTLNLELADGMYLHVPVDLAGVGYLTRLGAVALRAAHAIGQRAEPGGEGL